MSTPLPAGSRIADYLTACRIPSLFETLGAGDDYVPAKPPTEKELIELLNYLTKAGLKPAVVGSASAFHHLAIAFGKTQGSRGKTLADLWRPTKDIDIWVSGTVRLPAPPPGWTRDAESVGVDSWFSPSGGMVDFLIGGQQFPSGAVTPDSLNVSSRSPKGIPVADIFWVIRSKLGTGREKDMADVIDLLYAVKADPDYSKELNGFRAGLGRDQREELDTALLYLDTKRSGNLTLHDVEPLRMG